MINTKNIVLGALFAALAAMFQLIPVFLSELFISLTIFSALPIYIVSRINPKSGMIAFFVASMIIMILSVHEGLFFICTNGIIGVSLGICGHISLNKLTTWFICSFCLTIALCGMNYGMGIPIFGAQIPGVMIIQIAIIFMFSVIYNIFYFYFSNLIYNILKGLDLLSNRL